MQYWAIILLVMVGGGALVLMAYAVLRNFTTPESEENVGFREEQLGYMRDVRARTLEGLYAEVVAGNKARGVS